MNSYPENYFLLWILAFLEKASKKVLAPCPRPQNRGGVSINVVFWPARWPKIYYIFFLLAFLAVFLAGCATVTTSPVLLSPSPSGEGRGEVTANLALTPLSPTLTLTPLPSLTPTAIPLPSFTPTSTPIPNTPTPTADVRLLPSRWKQWPIIPTLTGHGLDIYRQGLALGNDPHAFSKVADCQGIREVLLGAYDLVGYYHLSPENADLQQTIDWFAGSFNRNGQAVMGGFNARAVLQPQFADPAACLPGETPIACEYRVHRPSIVLISLEFGYDGRTTENYVQYMRTIIDFYIGKGVLPILATKADNFEGGDSLNLATATLAYQYDLPLWNWWLAAQPLFNHGLDPTRPDGFHISVDAWRVRSSTALQAIDLVWRGVRDSAAQAQAAPAPTSTPAVTPLAASPTPLQAAPVGPAPALNPKLSAFYASGHALFGLAQRKGEGYEYLGVYAFDPNPKAANPLQPILGPGWNLQAVSPDGKEMLANRGSELWQIPLDGSAPQLITSKFYANSHATAAYVKHPIWSVAVIATEEGDQPALYVLSPGERSWARITKGSGVPSELFQAPNSGRVYWLENSCATCLSGSVESTVIDNPLINSVILEMPGVMRPGLSSDDTYLAYSFLNEKERTVLAVTTLDRTKIWSPLPDGYALDYAWSNSGRWLAALLLERSDYSGKAGALRGFLLNPLTLDKVELPAMGGLNALLAWSADGKFILAAATEPLNLRNTDFDKGYRLNLYLINAGAGTSTQLDGKISPSSQEYLFVTNMAWLP
jgi:hypothetical protein